MTGLWQKTPTILYSLLVKSKKNLKTATLQRKLLSFCLSVSSTHLVPIWFAVFANKVGCFRHLFRLETETVEMEPLLAAVALNPMNLKGEVNH